MDERKKPSAHSIAASSAWNWGIAAYLSTFSCLAWMNRVGLLSCAALLPGLTAAGFRYADLIGYQIYSSAVTVGYSLRPSDWTLTAEREKNWTTGEENAEGGDEGGGGKEPQQQCKPVPQEKKSTGKKEGK